MQRDFDIWTDGPNCGYGHFIDGFAANICCRETRHCMNDTRCAREGERTGKKDCHDGVYEEKYTCGRQNTSLQ